MPTDNSDPDSEVEVVSFAELESDDEEEDVTFTFAPEEVWSASTLVVECLLVKVVEESEEVVLASEERDDDHVDELERPAAPTNFCEDVGVGVDVFPFAPPLCCPSSSSSTSGQVGPMQGGGGTTMPGGGGGGPWGGGGPGFPVTAAGVARGLPETGVLVAVVELTSAVGVDFWEYFDVVDVVEVVEAEERAWDEEPDVVAEVADLEDELVDDAEDFEVVMDAEDSEALREREGF